MWCWGERDAIREQFGSDLVSIGEVEVPPDFTAADNLHVKGFLEEAICAAIARVRPVLSRATRSSAYLIADPHAEDIGALDALHGVVGKVGGIVPGLFSEVTDEYPRADQVCWAEAARISVDMRNGAVWLVVDPDVWIWPARSRHDATEFSGPASPGSVQRQVQRAPECVGAADPGYGRDGRRRCAERIGRL